MDGEDAAPPTRDDPALEILQTPGERLVAEALAVLEDAGEAGLALFLDGLGPERVEIEEQLALLRGAGLLEENIERLRMPERLGEYRLGRQLGAGGMGIVFEAQQASLRRLVALKLIRPEYGVFEASRMRFLREVEAVARLAHPGIVQVYTAGEDGGHLYFTMELIRGASLAEVTRAVHGRVPKDLQGADLARAVRVIAGVDAGSGTGEEYELFRGTWIDVVLRIGREVASALDHAHERGVHHRDVKPSNVLVTPTGRVVLVDFGLASLPGSTQLTRSTSRIGSPVYQAPESLEPGGARAGSPTDVYGLGVTLLELLTLERPFEGDSPAVVERRIREGRIQNLAALNPNARGDVETIIRTATDLDPARRYATAGDLQIDISNALLHRPIRARRSGIGLRIRRWVRRHSEAAAASAILGALLVAVATTFAVKQHRARANLALALGETQATLTSAQEAVGVLLDLANSDRLAQPEFEPLRRTAIGGALGFFSELLELTPESNDLRLGQVKARVSVGLLRVMQDRYSDAILEFRGAVEEGLALHAVAPRDEKVLYWLTRALSEAGGAARDAGLLTMGLEFAERAEQFGRELEAVIGPEQRPSWGLVNSIWVRAEIQEERLQFAESERAYSELLALEAAFLALEPDSPRRTIAAINTRMGFARMLVLSGAFQRALALTDDSMVELEAILAADARIFRGQEEYGRLALVRGHAYWGLDRRDEALAAYAASAAAYAPELRYAPDQPRFNRRLSITESEYGCALVAVGRRAEGLEVLRSAYSRMSAPARLQSAGPSAQRQLMCAATRLLPHLSPGPERSRLEARLAELIEALQPDASAPSALLEQELAAARAALRGEPISGPGPLRPL